MKKIIMFFLVMFIAGAGSALAYGGGHGGGMHSGGMNNMRSQTFQQGGRNFSHDRPMNFGHRQGGFDRGRFDGRRMDFGHGRMDFDRMGREGDFGHRSDFDGPSRFSSSRFNSPRRRF